MWHSENPDQIASSKVDFMKKVNLGHEILVLPDLNTGSLNNKADRLSTDLARKPDKNW